MRRNRYCHRGADVLVGTGALNMLPLCSYKRNPQCRERTNQGTFRSETETGLPAVDAPHGSTINTHSYFLYTQGLPSA